MKPDDPKARLFYWLTLVFGAAIDYQRRILRPSPRTLDDVSPQPPVYRELCLRSRDPSSYVSFVCSRADSHPACPSLPARSAFAGFQSAVFLYAILKPSVAAIHFYNKFYSVFRLYVVGYVLGAIVYLGLALRKGRTEERSVADPMDFFRPGGGVVAVPCPLPSADPARL